MHGFWSKKRANDAPSLSSDDSRDESLSSPTSSIAKFAEKNAVPTSVVITSSSNALPIARLNRKQTQSTAPVDNAVQPSVPTTVPPEIPQYETDSDNPKEKTKKRKLDSSDIVNILAAFDIEVDALVRRMQVDTEAHASTLRNSLQVELIKLPQKIRKMPIKQFLSEQALPTTIKKDLRTVQFDRDIKSPFATPKARPIAPNSAVKPITANVPETPSGPAALSFQLENGEQIDSTDLLTDANKINTMSKKARQDALLQLQQLQDQVNSLMSVLKR